MRNWTQFIIGTLLLISPWVLGFSDITLAKWCNVLFGLILMIMSAWVVFGPPPLIEEQAEKITNKHKK